jgi:hypothetical protein
MEKRIVYLCLFSFLILLISCVSSKVENQNKKFESFNFAFANDICNAEGSGNFVITKQRAQDLTNNFDTTFWKQQYGANTNQPLKSYWIDTCTVGVIADYLYNNPRIDGVRIYLGTYKLFNYRTTIYLVPTVNENGLHKDVIDYNFPMRNCTAFGEYFLNTAGDLQRIKDFDKIHRGNPLLHETAPRDSLSKAVWINRCVFKSIRKLVLDNNDYIDGINIKMGTYLKSDRIVYHGQEYKNRSTFIIVPTHNGNDDFDIIDIAIKKRYFGGGAYNHGELCPQICN